MLTSTIPLGIYLLLFSIFIVTLIILQKQLYKNKSLDSEINAISAIFSIVLRINLQNNTASFLKKNRDVDYILGASDIPLSDLLQFAAKISKDDSSDLLTKFLDTSTVNERLDETNSISLDFLSFKNHWLRARYIVIDRDRQGQIASLLLAFESIDEDKRQQEKLRRLSETDRMTGLLNRYSGEKKVRELIAAGVYGMFCFIDADKFKSVNDECGHSTGDKVIVAIAESLTHTFRESDIIYRIGGDEFCVYSVGVISNAIGSRILERLFEKIDIIDVPELQGRKITLSAGAAFFTRKDPVSYDELYKRADDLMYASKKTDGHCVTFETAEQKE